MVIDQESVIDTMADNTNTDDGFFREVDEAVRQEKLHFFWKKYKWVLCSSFLFIILSIGAFFFYKKMNQDYFSSASKTFVVALDYFYSGKNQEALTQLDKVVKEGPPIYRVLAKIQKASILAEKEDQKQAVRMFDDIANDESIDAAFRDIARIRSIVIAVDSLSYKQVQERLEKVSNKKNPIYLIGEESLGLSAWKEKKMKESYKIFHNIALNPSTPVHVRRRSRIMIDLICSSILCESFE